MAQDKIATPTRGGSSARACILYALGEEAARKVDHAQRDDPLHPQQKTDVAVLFAEARARDDLGVGAIWSPAAGGGKRPSSIYARGVWSLETAAFDIEAVARTQPRVKQPVQHIIISLSEAETKTVSDETLIRMAEMAVDHAGFAEHQAVFTVHRDTPNAHCHVAVASVSHYTLKAWDRYHGWNRLDEGVRYAEIAFGLEFGNGLAVVRDAGLSTQRVEWATTAEKKAWARERELAKERLEDQARSYLSDSDGLELTEDRCERIVTKLRKMLDDVEERREHPLRADVHLIAAGLAATIEPGAEGALRLRLMDRAEEKKIVRESTDALGDKVQRIAKWTPSDVVFDVPLRQLAPGPLDAGGKATQDERHRQAAAVARRAWLADLGTVEDSEREVEELLERDPGRISRDIVAAGDALFTVEAIDRWTCSRISDGGPELSDRVLRTDPTLVVRSADTEHPLLTTRAQLDLERHVFNTASKVTQERNPLFDRAKLERAFTDVEADRSFAGGKPFRFTAEQRAVLDVLEYRYGTCNGVAGAGKSDLMAVVRRYAELTNQPVVGLATAQLAAENLAKKSGIASVNSTRGLVLEKARGKDLVASNGIVIVDEYSMTSLDSAKEILDRIADRPAASVLYLGGGAQLPNIEAGNTHRVLTQTAQQHDHHRELTEVFRQTGESVRWMRDVVPALDKAILDADPAGARRGFGEFEKHGHLRYHPDRKSEIEGKADDIVQAYQRGVRVIAPGCERIEVKYVNRAVRERLGHVGKGILYDLEGRKREFSPDDRVVFTKNAESRLGVLNGYTGTVLAVGPRRISVKLDGGRTVDVDPAKYPHLEWGYAVTTHKSQGMGDPLVVASITKSDDARSAYVALTRCEEDLHVHTRLLPFDPARPQTEKHKELLEHLTSDAALRPADDALLFEQTVRRTGGEHTPWAKAVRRGLEHDADPLRQQHRDEMRQRSEARGQAIVEVLTRYGKQRERVPEAGNERLGAERREQKFAGIAAAERRDLERIDQRFALESFVSWSVRRRKDVEREAPFLDRLAQRDDHREQRQRYEEQKTLEREAERVRAEQRVITPEQLERVCAALSGAVAISGTAGEEYLRGRGCHGLTGDDVRYAAGGISPGDGPSAVFALRNGQGELVALQARLLEPRVLADGSTLRMRSLGSISNAVFATPGALEADTVAICEAPIDALSLAAVGVPAIALCGAGNRPDFLRKALTGKEVVIATDSDRAGESAAKELSAWLCDDSSLARLKLPAGMKDCNQALQEHPAALGMAVAQARTDCLDSLGRAWRRAWKESAFACEPSRGVEHYRELGETGASMLKKAQRDVAARESLEKAQAETRAAERSRAVRQTPPAPRPQIPRVSDEEPQQKKSRGMRR